MTDMYEELHAPTLAKCVLCGNILYAWEKQTWKTYCFDCGDEQDQINLLAYKIQVKRHER